MDKEEIESIIVNEVSCYYDGITGYGKAAEEIAALFADRLTVELENDIKYNFAESEQEVMDVVERIVTDEAIPLTEIWFVSGNKRVGRIVNIGTT